MKINSKTKLLAIAAFFVALDIIVARFFSFEVVVAASPVKFDFQIVVAALCGFTLGPIWGAITLTAADLLGVFLNSGSLGAFLGFTLSAFMRGLLFGLLLHKTKLNWLVTILSTMVVFIITDILLNTCWLSILTGTSYMPLLISRIIPKTILMVVEITLILGLTKLFAIIEKDK